MRPISHLGTTMSTTKAAAAATSPSTTPVPATAQPHSPWHSPVPYLFGGLAAMLGLIAFALLILACSYWRLSGRLDSENEGNDQRDLESGNEKEGSNAGKAENRVYEEKFLVIMAGNEKPTFLATPACSKVSSFVAKSDNQEAETTGDHDKVKNQAMASDSHDQARTTLDEENTETLENQQQVQEELN